MKSEYEKEEYPSGLYKYYIRSFPFPCMIYYF